MMAAIPNKQAPSGDKTDANGQTWTSTFAFVPNELQLLMLEMEAYVLAQELLIRKKGGGCMMFSGDIISSEILYLKIILKPSSSELARFCASLSFHNGDAHSHNDDSFFCMCVVNINYLSVNLKVYNVSLIIFSGPVKDIGCLSGLYAQ